MQDIAAEGLARRCRDKSIRPRQAVKQVKLEGHFMFAVDGDDADKLTRLK